MDAILTTETLSFLEQNYVVFDRRTGRTHKDFGALKGCKVVGVGQRHHTTILTDIENQFLKLFGSKKSCLLVETLPPGKSLTKEEVIWPDIPEGMAILGADSRSNGNLDREWFVLQKEILKLDRENTQAVRNCFCTLSQILNEEVWAGEAKVINGELVLSPQIYDKIADLWTKYTEIIHTWVEKFNLLEEQQGAISDSARTFHSLSQSNRDLLQTIFKAAKEYVQVFIIYGEAHFCTGEELLDGLENDELPYIILLPNSERDKEAKIERKLQTHRMRLGKLTITKLVPDQEKTKKVTRRFSVPRAFQDLYLPVIQNLLTYEPKHKKASLDLKSLNFSEMDFHESYFEFPADTYVKISDFSPSHYYAIDEFQGFIRNKKADPDEANKWLDKYLALAFNDLLLFHGMSVDRLVFHERTFSQDYKNRKNLLLLSSPDPFKLYVRKGKMQTSARFLLREMIRRDLSAFSVKANQTLLFTDFTPEEEELLSTEPSCITQLLSKKGARDRKVEFKGEGGFNVTTTYDGLSISSDRDFTITLD